MVITRYSGQVKLATGLYAVQQLLSAVLGEAANAALFGCNSPSSNL